MACAINLFTLLTGTPATPGKWTLQSTTNPAGIGSITLSMAEGAPPGAYSNVTPASNTEILNPGGGATDHNLWWDPQPDDAPGDASPGCNTSWNYVFRYTPDAIEGGCISPGFADVTWTLINAEPGATINVNVCDNNPTPYTFANLVTTFGSACNISFYNLGGAGSGTWTCQGTTGGAPACPASPPLTLSPGSINTNDPLVAAGQTYTVRYTKDIDGSGTCADCVKFFDMVITILASGSAGGPGSVTTCV